MFLTAQYITKLVKIHNKEMMRPMSSFLCKKEERVPLGEGGEG
jgi:hypothetical protein